MVRADRRELSRDIDRYLAVLSRLYGQNGEIQKQEIIVNAQVTVHDDTSYDNWNGGTYGHTLHLTVPADLYLGVSHMKDELQSEIAKELNEVHNVSNELIDEVFIEMDVQPDSDWRRDSGLLRAGERAVPLAAEERIWGDPGYRVFLSHKSEVKRETSGLKSVLEIFGISCFVAHNDIEPTREWQAEIENALASTDAFVALLTDEFRDSDWTDQEVGFAVGRGVPLIAVRLGFDPYGFIGKFQALTCNWETAPMEICKLLVNYPRMLDSFIEKVERCPSFDRGNELAELLPSIRRLTEGQALRLVEAYNSNLEVRGSFGFNGTVPRPHGAGLAKHLSRVTPREYRMDSDGRLLFT